MSERPTPPGRTPEEAPVDPSDFYSRVWALVERIPAGRVTTYGHIAETLGARRSARLVGWALTAAVGRPGVPCHRVVNRSGALTGARHFETPLVMEERLRAEGVGFDDEGRVRMEDHVWIPGEEGG